MAAPTTPAPPPGPPAPEIYEATRATDGSGAVDRGNLLTRAQAEDRRRAGLDIVVCSPNTPANCQLAREIEEAVTPAGAVCLHHGPHRGALSLPHWQQRRGTPPPGHSFYETHIRQARVTP
jgi:hypothetical protein